MRHRIMDCHHFEHCFESYLAGELPAAERSACDAHLVRCPACRELLELAVTTPAAPPEDLVAAVLAGTSGPACGRAEELLAARLDGVEPMDDPLDREVLELHLASCGDCRALARVLAALARDLPELAEVRPDRRFTDDVLARTLPLAARWRRVSRSWAGRWAAWVRRPRFAWEAAFVLTVACLPVLTSSASPIPPLAAAARELTAENPVARVESRLDRTLSEAGGAVMELEAVQRTGRGVAEAREVVEDLGARTAAWAELWTGTIGDSWRTLRDGTASFLMKAAEAGSEPRRPEETDRKNPTDTSAGDGSKGETR